MSEKRFQEHVELAQFVRCDDCGREIIVKGAGHDPVKARAAARGEGWLSLRISWPHEPPKEIDLCPRCRARKHPVAVRTTQG